MKNYPLSVVILFSFLSLGAQSPPTVNKKPVVKNTPLKNYERIDVHAHYVTGEYRRAAIAAGYAQPDGMPDIPAWSPEMALRLMDSIHVSKAILSISSPGVHFGNDAAARLLARSVNEEASRIGKKYPGRFGFFASLPLPDFNGAMAEMIYALDTLKADGVVLETNANGVYIGDEQLDSLFAALNRRKAIVFIHPSAPVNNCGADLGYPLPMLEFMFETTRSVTNLLMRRVNVRFPDVKIIAPHSGGTLTALADRVAGFTSIVQSQGKTTINNTELFAGFKSLYYDLAGVPLPRELPALLTMADPTHIFYGTDFPFTPEYPIIQLAKQLDQSGLSQKQLRMFMSENAKAVFRKR